MRYVRAYVMEEKERSLQLADFRDELYQALAALSRQFAQHCAGKTDIRRFWVAYFTALHAHPFFAADGAGMSAKLLAVRNL